MTVIELETQEEFNTFIKSEKLSIIDFWATWCPPCVAIAPWYKEQAEKYSSDFLQVAKVDVDENDATSQDQKISCMPTFKIYQNGECIKTIEGADKTQLLKMFELKENAVEELKKQAEEEKKLAELFAKLMPMCENLESYERFIADKNFTLVNFYVEDYKDEVDELLKNLKSAVEDESCSNITSDNLKRCDLRLHGEIGNDLKIKSLPHLRICKDGKLVEIIEENDMEKVKKILAMSDAEIEKLHEEKKLEEERLKKLVPQLDTEEEYMSKIKDSENIIVVDYYATWCGPCIHFAPTFLKMADEYEKDNKRVKFCKIDCDKNTAAKKHAEIKCFPTFQIWKNGEKLGACEGASKVKLTELIEKHLV